MKFEVEKSAFLGAIQKVQAVVERRNAVQLLSNVRIQVSENQMEVTATDLEVGLRDIQDVQVHDPGSITVSAKKLYEVLKELPEDHVTFAVEENNWIQISCGYSRFRLVGSPDEDFPKLPDVTGVDLITISGELMDFLTRKTAYSVSTDENRRVLTGVLFTVDPGMIRMVATDGHRLALIDRTNDMGLQDLEVILPQKAIHEVQRMTGAGNVDLQMGIMDNHIIFQVAGETVIARKIEGQFPDFNMVLPKEIQSEIVLDKHALYNSLRRVSLFSDIKARGVKLVTEDNVLRVSASTPEYGEASDELMIEYDGEPLTIGFNVNYLLDLLRTIDSESVVMQISTASGPVVFRPTEDPENNYNYLAIVMPMII